MEQSNVLAEFSFENLGVLKPGHDLRPGTVFWGGEQGKNMEKVSRAPSAMARKLWQLGADLSPTLCAVSRHRREFVGVAQVAPGSVRSWNIWAAISRHGSLCEGGSSSENIPVFVSLNTCCWRQNIWIGKKKYKNALQCVS